ncbi:MAG: relaxase/mobilization nuclease domain-containing protein [Propionibacteriaceae bacterium]|nr:relaxase/mobilization nuclease domain-containing protein [Propionibacteriaceae bacterium]
MSTTSIVPKYDLGVATDYLQFGKGEKKRTHLAEGTNRIAPGFYCDAGSIDEFIELGNHLATTNKRRVRAHSIVQSFAPDEFNVDDPADLQYVGDLGFELAKRMFPNSPCLVVVHADSDGRNAHSHITVLNHDLVTGKAPTKNRTHSQLKAINDQLMREHGLRTVDRPHGGNSGRWADIRGERLARIEAGTPKRYEEFDVAIGDNLADAKKAALSVDDLDAFMERFEAELADRGVAMKQTEHEVKTESRKGHKKGDIVHGLTYEMLDEVTPTYKPRKRRRAASKVSAEFTLEGLAADVEAERQRRLAEAQRQQAAAAQQRREAMLTPTAEAAPTPEPTVERPGSELRRLLDELREARLAADDVPVAVEEAEQEALATAPASPPPLATAPDGDLDGAQAEESALAAAPADRSSLAAAPDEPEPFRSRLREYEAKTKSEKETADKLAVLDEQMVAWREEGRLPDENIVKTYNVGKEKLEKYGSWFEPENERLLIARHEKLVKANRSFELGTDVGRTRAATLRAAVAEGRYETAAQTAPKPLSAAQHAQQMAAEAVLEDAVHEDERQR